MKLNDNLYISFTRDEEISGWYCQVYDDDDYQHEVDNFCIHNCATLDDAEHIVKDSIDMNFLFE